MKAVGVLPRQREVSVLDHEAPQLQRDDQVKVRSVDVGLCGTDREICTFVYGAPPNGSDYLVLGHESLGEVVEVGQNVSRFKPGDLVVPSVRRPCRHDHCRPCQSELQDFCSTGDFTERGIKLDHGFMTEFFVEQERFLYWVAPELRDVAVLVEPLTIIEKAISRVWTMQQSLPWIQTVEEGRPSGRGLKAVVLGAGPVGILGALKLKAEGFETLVYSRSSKPNPKAELLEACGIPYLSIKDTCVEELAERVGEIDLVYEAVGKSKLAFDVLSLLSLNGIYIMTGIPMPEPGIEINGDRLMKDIVLKNQVIFGTVNADGSSFESAIQDLKRFKDLWPEALRSIITQRHQIDASRQLLLDAATGIKNVISFG